MAGRLAFLLHYLKLSVELAPSQACAYLGADMADMAYMAKPGHDRRLEDPSIPCA